MPSRTVTKSPGKGVESEALIKLIEQTIVSRRHPIKLFGLDASKTYAERVAQEMSLELVLHTEKAFDDGECYVKPGDGDKGNVRGANVFVIQSLHSDDNESASEKFMKLAIFCAALRSASAYSITCVVPYLAWARQDRKTESRAPVTTQARAQMLEAVGMTHALFWDVHNLAAEQNAFRVPIDVLESKNLMADWAVSRLDLTRKLAILSPDAGGTGRADRLRNAICRRLKRNKAEVELAIFDKVRQKDGTTKGGKIIGDIKDAQVLICDDMIATAGTMALAAEAVPRFGGELFALCATHGLFVGDANTHLEQINAPIVVTDTVPPFRLNDLNRQKLHVVSTTEMTAKAIWRIHEGTGSISDLLR